MFNKEPGYIQEGKCQHHHFGVSRYHPHLSISHSSPDTHPNAQTHDKYFCLIYSFLAFVCKTLHMWLLTL